MYSTGNGAGDGQPKAPMLGLQGVGHARWHGRLVDGQRASNVGEALRFRLSGDGHDIGGFEMKVLEFDPAKRVPWQVDDGDEAKHSRVAFDIEPYADGLFRLTVTHEDLERDTKMFAGVSGGWPTVLSNLKTFLETGRALPRTPSAS